MNPASEIKKDLLSMSSTVSEILRAMYMCAADYIMVVTTDGERLAHKLQLVALMERGREDATAADLISEQLKESAAASTRIEDIPTAAPLLLLREAPTGAAALSLTTFGDLRENRIGSSGAFLPEWWNVPLPLVYFDEEQVLLNPAGEEMVPGGAVAIARQIDRRQADRIITIKDSKQERTLSLSPLEENTYLISDISGDFEMAEDLAWWAAVGRAFVTRMQSNGLTVKRLSPFEEIPSDASEVIPCRWENELVGRLAITMPKPEKPAERPKRPRPVKRAPAKPKQAEPPAPDEQEQETIAVETETAAPEAELDPPQPELEEIKKMNEVRDGLRGKRSPRRTEQQETADEEPKPERENLRAYAAKTAYGIRSPQTQEDEPEETESEVDGDTSL